MQLEAITLQPAELYSAVLRARQWGKVTVEHVGGMLKWSLHFFQSVNPKDLNKTEMVQNTAA